nr:PD40 domain-containing protein [Pedobacter panaciterrae]
MKTIYFIILCAVITGLSACSKKGDDGPIDSSHFGSGNLYYDWSEGAGLAVVYKLDLNNASRSKALAYNANRHAWDVSRDGNKMIQSLADPNDFDSEIYRIINMSNGQTISEFKKPGTELSSFTEPIFSPDMTLIAVPPTFDRGLLILNMQGQLIKEVVTIGGNKIKGHISWMPDKSILCTVGNTIYRLNNSYTYGNIVSTINFSDWNHVTVSNDGSKIAYAGGKHIWLMNADGSDLKQISTSNNEEGYPVFSPDGKYLLIGSNYLGEGNAIQRWELTIIPADGQQYNVNDGVDKRVIPIKLKNSESTQELCNYIMEWR